MALKIEWTGHARRRMRQRHVAEEEVRRVLSEPDRTATDADGDPVSFRRFADGVIVKVAYVVEADVHVIKTVVCPPGRSK